MARIEKTIAIDRPADDSHRASMTVEGTGGGSQVTWVTEIEPDDLAPAMEPLFEDGIHSLKEHLEAG